MYLFDKRLGNYVERNDLVPYKIKSNLFEKGKMYFRNQISELILIDSVIPPITCKATVIRNMETITVPIMPSDFDYEMRPFEEQSWDPIIKGEVSITAAEIRAYTYLGFFGKCTNRVIHDYFSGKENAPDDWVYYFVKRKVQPNGYLMISLVRDQVKSPSKKGRRKNELVEKEKRQGRNE